MLKLERIIENKTISETHLPLVQEKLDEMDRELKRSGYSEPDIHILYEIQVLIYGEQNQDEKLKDCLAEAVRIAGGPEALSSSLLRDYAKSALPVYIPFVRRSLTAVFLLNFFTLGLYGLIWFEKNWRAVKKAKPQKMWPYWRAIFSWFWALATFQRND